MFFIRVITAKTKIFILAQNFPMPWIRILACGIQMNSFKSSSLFKIKQMIERIMIPSEALKE